MFFLLFLFQFIFNQFDSLRTWPHMFHIHQNYAPTAFWHLTCTYSHLRHGPARLRHDLHRTAKQITLNPTIRTPFEWSRPGTTRTCSCASTRPPSLYSTNLNFDLSNRSLLDSPGRLSWTNGIGDLFDMLLPMLVIYQEYVRNHHFSLQVLAECKQKEKFSSILRRLEEKPVLQGRSLETFLTYPMHQVKFAATNWVCEDLAARLIIN